MIWNRRILRYFLLLAGVALGQAPSVRSDEPADLKSRALEFQKLATRELAAVHFRTEGAGAPVVVHPESILKWTNPIFRTYSGGLYLWTVEGRPEVVASIFIRNARQRPEVNTATDELTDEFQSLSLGRFEMERDGVAVWNCSRPGVELKLVPEAPVPAGKPAQRLRQMRELAARFTGSQSIPKGQRREMRLLPQPVYRYVGTVNELIDGAMFVLVDATDPQVILLVEARTVEGLPRWHYSLARMTHERLWVSHRGQEVWTAPPLSPTEARDHRVPYTKFFFPVEETAAAPECP